MGVDLRRPRVIMAQQFLNCANVCSFRQQLRGKGMPEGMAGYPLMREPGLPHRAPQRFADHTLMLMPPTEFAIIR